MLQGISSYRVFTRHCPKWSPASSKHYYTSLNTVIGITQENIIKLFKSCFPTTPLKEKGAFRINFVIKFTWREKHIVFLTRQRTIGYCRIDMVYRNTPVRQAGTT